MSALGAFQISVRFHVLQGKSDQEIRDHFCGLIRNSRIDAALRIVHADLAARRFSENVIMECDGGELVEFAPGHVAKHWALRAMGK